VAITAHATTPAQKAGVAIRIAFLRHPRWRKNWMISMPKKATTTSRNNQPAEWSW
jgi:hypothetical protein